MASIKGSQSCFSVIDDSVEMMPKEMAAGSSAAGLPSQAEHGHGQRADQKTRKFHCSSSFHFFGRILRPLCLVATLLCRSVTKACPSGYPVLPA
jgi:hypothetical protein